MCLCGFARVGVFKTLNSTLALPSPLCSSAIGERNPPEGVKCAGGEVSRHSVRGRAWTVS